MGVKKSKVRNKTTKAAPIPEKVGSKSQCIRRDKAANCTLIKGKLGRCV